ncbi:AraC family transcriptional regulator [Salinivibrio sp. IB574]|nr:hypothetical protein BGK46_12840 [Salinivibrio sp. DV]OOF19846.1 AraC family transcriptional regulator [Salinivibrio sp. IB574]
MDVMKAAEQHIATRFNRIERVLAYIHANLDQPLNVADLAALSCWSRWQLQRVFSEQTGVNVAHYVRELKLGQAAQQLVMGQSRVIDIALMYGFGSEASFSRAFRQHFGMTPRHYRQRGVMDGIRTPMHIASLTTSQPSWLSVHIKTREPMHLVGQLGYIRGLFSSQPDFTHVVPELWQHVHQSLWYAGECESIGAINVTQAETLGEPLPYLAGQITMHPPEDNAITHWIIPATTYAVITHTGPVSALPETLKAFIYHWLPQSGYTCTDGVELEVYPPHYQPADKHAVMHYWVPLDTTHFAPN